MVHHWRASDHLEPSLVPGEWRMFDRGRLVGVIQAGRVNGKRMLRGLTPDGQTLGYERELEAACDRLWAWHVANHPLISGRVAPDDLGRE
jgi:hypothetical protein